MHISFPHYSFVKRPDNAQVINSDPTSPIVDCVIDELPPLPVSDPHNLAFQCVYKDLPLAPIGNVDHLEFFVDAVPADLDCQPLSTASFDPQNYLGFIYASKVTLLGINGSLFDYAVQFAQPTASWDWYNEHGPYAIEQGQCFKLRFMVYSIDRDNGEPSYLQIIGCSNTMVRIAREECYTSQISYRCQEDSFDFDYTTDTSFYNRVELPFSLVEPKLVSDEKRYTRSDGSIAKLYERKEEEYIVETDLLPYNWLRKLEVALSHDVVLVHNPIQLTYDSDQGYISVVKSDAFEIAYTKERSLTRMGTGKCKVRNTNPVHLINNNCR